jgi:ribonuclease P protein component
MKLRFGFQPQQRLLKPVDFKYVFKKPAKSVDAYFTVLARTNQLTIGRLGLAIAKKRVKRAVARNRLKRLIRESFRYHQADLIGIDCVILVQEKIEQASNQLLLKSLANHWRRIRRIM